MPFSYLDEDGRSSFFVLVFKSIFLAVLEEVALVFFLISDFLLVLVRNLAGPFEGLKYAKVGNCLNYE